MAWSLGQKGPDSPPVTMQYLCSTVEHEGQNTGGAVAVTKGLVGQVDGLVGKFSSTFYGKSALKSTFSYSCTCSYRVARKRSGTCMLNVNISSRFYLQSSSK